MYEYIRGDLISAHPTHAIVETNGIAYKIHIPLSSSTELTSPIQLYLSLQVRETSHTLYGFLTPDDRDLFETLTTVSGIGPKTALGLIGNLPAGALQEAIATNDPAILARVPGVGKRTAERLIMEMRDKLPKLLHALPSSTAQDALTALINLGYTRSKVQKALQKILKTNASLDLSTLITTTIKELA